MTTIDLTPLYRSTIGFDRFGSLLDAALGADKSSSAGYPPYNIEVVAEDRYAITLAVAGFSRDQLDIAVENKQLTISGKQSDDNSREYLHRGIAARQFKRSFVLADGIEVIDARLENGLLAIELVRPEQEKLIRKVEIKQ